MAAVRSPRNCHSLTSPPAHDLTLAQLPLYPTTPITLSLPRLKRKKLETAYPIKLPPHDLNLNTKPYPHPNGWNQTKEQTWPHPSRNQNRPLTPRKETLVPEETSYGRSRLPREVWRQEKESPPGVDVDLLLGLSAGEGAGPTLAEDEQMEKGTDQNPTREKNAETPEKEKTPTPSKGKQTSSSLRKVKAESSAAASSPVETEVEGSEAEASEEEVSEEVNSSEAGEDGDEKEAEEEEGTDEDEPLAKRAKTPSQGKEKETVTVAKKDLAGRKIIAPKRLDFDALEELGIAKEVREKFTGIGWEKFLDLDTTAYTELVREFFKKLKVVAKGAEGPAYIEFTLMGKREMMTPNQINS